MARIHSYVVRYDSGFAPNPFYGYCTLATCKPSIRKGADIGDWVVGSGSNDRNIRGFVAQVEKSRYDPYPRRSYATAGTATVVGHPSCVNRLSKATRTCNSVT